MSEISGLILLDKPAGPTSHDMVYRARKKLNISTIGHSGTLDPAATGLLILLVGRSATKRQEEFLRMNKVYSGVVLFGVETDTWDMAGKIIYRKEDFEISDLSLEKALKSLTGEIVHRVPPYSAAKRDGIPLYKLARKNLPVPVLDKKVSVKWLSNKLNGHEMSFTVECSSGTYIRSLAMHLGKIIGSGASLKSLRREKIGPYCVEKAFNEEAFEKASPQELITPL